MSLQSAALEIDRNLRTWISIEKMERILPTKVKQNKYPSAFGNTFKGVL